MLYSVFKWDQTNNIHLSSIHIERFDCTAVVEWRQIFPTKYNNNNNNNNKVMQKLKKTHKV